MFLEFNLQSYLKVAVTTNQQICDVIGIPSQRFGVVAPLYFPNYHGNNARMYEETVELVWNFVLRLSQA